MAHRTQLTCALFTYIADEEITPEILNDAYAQRPRHGPIARTFRVVEMHTRHIDGIYFLAMRFRPRQSAQAMRRLLEHIQVIGNINMVPHVFPGLDRWLYMGTAELYSPQGRIIRNVIRANGPPHRHSFFTEANMNDLQRVSVMYDGPMPRRGRRAAAPAVAGSPQGLFDPLLLAAPAVPPVPMDDIIAYDDPDSPSSDEEMEEDEDASAEVEPVPAVIDAPHPVAPAEEEVAPPPPVEEEAAAPAEEEVAPPPPVEEEAAAPAEEEVAPPVADEMEGPEDHVTPVHSPASSASGAGPAYDPASPAYCPGSPAPPSSAITVSREDIADGGSRVPRISAPGYESSSSDAAGPIGSRGTSVASSRFEDADHETLFIEIFDRLRRQNEVHALGGNV